MSMNYISIIFTILIVLAAAGSRQEVVEGSPPTTIFSRSDYVYSDVDEESSSSVIVVDHSGSSGDFQSVQSAIDSVPDNNLKWITIHVKEGTYSEKITVPAEKTRIVLQGEGANVTWIVWGDYSDTAHSATFSTFADHFVARDISFMNTYNFPARKRVRSNPNQYDDTARLQAVATRVSGNQSVFYRCGFYGLQDTLWDDTGSHYFKKCRIEGAVDFIFGAGQSIYEECWLQANSAILGPLPGIITAQGRKRAEDPNGFVFKWCQIHGTSMTYLGRAWRPYSRVLFYQTYMDDIIVPQGWVAWTAMGKEYQLTYAEIECKGPGANTTGRDKWVILKTNEELSRMANLSFIDEDGWTKPFSDKDYGLLS